MGGIKDICIPWDDVFDVTLDEYLAPELGDIFLNKRNIYTDPFEFFSRTYLTESMFLTLENIVDVLKGEGGNNIFTIYSLFGGGKTHTLFAIYHALRKPELLAHEEILKDYGEEKKKRIRQLAKSISTIGNLKIVVIYGKDYKLCGRPSSPIETPTYKVNTIWGYLAHSLGKYEDIRNDDENLTPPDVSTLRKILGDDSIVILIDEIVDYAYGLKASKHAGERAYVDTIPQFLDRLTSAVLGTKTALIVALPVETRGSSVERTESWYELDFVKKYWTALHRAGARDLPALKIETEEIVNVIKKRNFKHIDQNEAQTKIKDFHRVYKDYESEVFGRYSEVIRKFYNTYPYYPEFVETLWDIVEKAGLQKTRDMLKLTRKIIRKLWNDGTNPYAIMPWHFDITQDEFHPDLFRSGMFNEYLNVIRRDIIENSKKFDNPDLVKKIAIVIFLKTYIHDSPVPQAYFPSSQDIAKMVYEQEYFLKNNLLPPAIIDALNELENKAYMHYLQIKDGRYWFWKIASVKEQIESESRRLLDEDPELVKLKVKDYVEKLAKGVPFSKRGRKKQVSSMKVLSPRTTYVTSSLEFDVPDTTEYKTVILVNEEANEKIADRVMFHYKEGERKYKNTIVCVYPSSDKEFKNCLRYAANMLACEKIRERLDELYPEASEEILRVQESIIDKIYNASEGELERQIFRTFKNIAYPIAVKEKSKGEVEVVPAVEGAATLLEQTFLTLVSPQVAKILDSLDFEGLVRELKDNLDIDIEHMQPKRVSEVKSWFKINPAFPMVEEVDIDEAIREGVRKLAIGISNDKIWYKKIYKTKPDLISDKGDSPDILRDDDRILPWKDALERQVEQLLKKAEESGDKVKIEYEVDYEGSIYPLKQLLVEEDWQEIVRGGFVIRHEKKVTREEKDFEIELDPGRVTTKYGETVNVKVKVKPLRAEEIYVKLLPKLGEITPNEGKLPLVCNWKIVVPYEQGMKSVVIVAESEGITKSNFLILRIESEIISTKSLEESHKGMNIIEIRELSDLELLKILNGILSQKPIVAGGVSYISENREIFLEFKNIEGDVVEYLIEHVREFIEGYTTINLHVHIPGEGLEIDELILHKVLPFSGKATYVLKKRG